MSLSPSTKWTNQPLSNRKGQYPEEGMKIKIVACFIISLKIFLTQCSLHRKVMQGETDIIYQEEKNILTLVILAGDQ